LLERKLVDKHFLKKENEKEKSIFNKLKLVYIRVKIIFLKNYTRKYVL